MKRIFCFATGNMWRWVKGNKAKLIDYIKELDVSGAELTFSSKEELYNFRLNSKQVKWLKKCDYVSIHAPFRLVRRANNKEEVIKQLDCIKKIYGLVNARNVIIHPNDLPPRKLLDEYDVNFSTENLPKKRHVTIKKLSNIFKKYPNLGLCLDVAHAYLWSRFETGKLVKKFKNRIIQVHFSGTYRKRDHVPLQSVSPIFLKSIKPIKELRIPIVIEEDIKVKSIKFVKDEIRYIKSLF